MGSATGKVDSVKEELGWLKVLFAVLAAVDAPLVAWLSQNYTRANRAMLVGAGVMAIAGTVYLLRINYAAWRKLGELKSLS